MTRANLLDNRDELLDRLAGLRADASRRWGKMTAHQMVCHCTDAFRNLLGERPTAPTASRGPIRARLIKWIALYAPTPWPRGIRTRPEADQERGGTRPEDFERDVASLKRATDRFAKNLAVVSVRPHFMFGKLSEREWARWAYLHLDHHFRQFGL
ncbi:MAG TPA: DUF1569 domain-containing protein [Gemmatimonadaceae bacterium]|nr:DUF1569 domain-containing protein [Gemmatimonadaceae bacterium]